MTKYVFHIKNNMYGYEAEGEVTLEAESLQAAEERARAIDRLADVTLVKIVDCDIENAFINTVWSVLKSDSSDLNKERKILTAFRNAQEAFLRNGE